VVASRDHATDFDESEVGLSAVAVPVRDPQGWPLAAISVCAPASRLPEQRVLQYVPAGRRASGAHPAVPTRWASRHMSWWTRAEWGDIDEPRACRLGEWPSCPPASTDARWAGSPQDHPDVGAAWLRVCSGTLA
jgi:hypothetical protein